MKLVFLCILFHYFSVPTLKMNTKICICMYFEQVVNPICVYRPFFGAKNVKTDGEFLGNFISP